MHNSHEKYTRRTELDKDEFIISKAVQQITSQQANIVQAAAAGQRIIDLFLYAHPRYQQKTRATASTKNQNFSKVCISSV